MHPSPTLARRRRPRVKRSGSGWRRRWWQRVTQGHHSQLRQRPSPSLTRAHSHRASSPVKQIHSRSPSRALVASHSPHTWEEDKRRIPRLRQRRSEPRHKRQSQQAKRLSAFKRMTLSSRVPAPFLSLHTLVDKWRRSHRLRRKWSAHKKHRRQNQQLPAVSASRQVDLGCKAVLPFPSHSTSQTQERSVHQYRRKSPASSLLSCRLSRHKHRRQSRSKEVERLPPSRLQKI